MKENNKTNAQINKEKSKSSTDAHMTLDPTKPLSEEQKQQLHDLSNLPDQIVSIEAETDPDCGPLDKPETVE